MHCEECGIPFEPDLKVMFCETCEQSMCPPCAKLHDEKYGTKSVERD